jgi:hypothetical protein
VLGSLPDQPRARRTWQQAATRIEAYRFDLGVTDAHHALGLAPSESVSVRIGSGPITTFSMLSAISIGGSTVGTRTRSDQRVLEPPRRCGV